MSVHSSIPKVIADQGSRADALIASLNEQGADRPPTADSSFEQTTDPTPSNGSQEPVQNVDQLTTDAQPQEPVTPEPSTNPTPTEGSAEHWQGVAQSWEHKYQVLAGKYNKEIAAVRDNAALQPEFDHLKQEKAALEQQVQALTLQLANQPKEQPEHSSALESDEVKEILDHLSSEYGDDLVNGFAQLIKASEQNTSEHVGNLANKVEAVSSNVEKVERSASATSQQQAQQLYTQKVGVLTELLKSNGIDFKQVDDDPLFHDWLSKYEQDTGKQRQTILMELFHSGDLETVAGMYIAYIQASGTPQLNAPTPNTPAVDFDEQVQIETNAPRNKPNLDGEPNKWDGESIAQFYQDVANKRYTPEEAQRLEREIFAQLRK